MIFRVWAPKPERVELILDDRRLAMSPERRGWWMLDVSDAAPGDRYAFSLDGGPPRPDPRSQDQPGGVHEASRIVDQSAYRWRCPGFRPPALASAVIYELHVGTFTPVGTLDAAAERLDHLVDLGITHVELMPLNAFDGERGWGYDGVAWFAPHRAYTGPDGPDAVKRFVDACHERGLAVLLDVVYNHLGPSGNYLGEFGPYFTDHYSTPWGAAVNLDGAGSDGMRSLIIDNALMWLGDYRFDGLRLDAIHAFHDRSALHILEELRRAVDRFQAATGRRVDLIAESDLNDPRIVRSPEAGGYGMDAQWSDDFHHALHALLTGERQGYYADFGSVAQLAKAWRRAFVFDGQYAEFRGRRHGRPATGLHSARFLAYAQTHDQVGNRALGDRLGSLLGPRELELAAALVLLSPFVPMLFQGEEWGSASPFQYFTDHRDPELGRAVREGRRGEFRAFLSDQEIPDPQDRATFERSRLDWDARQDGPHNRLQSWHKQLIRFRREHPDLAPGALDRVTCVHSEAPPWLRVDRGGLSLYFNFGAEEAEIPAGPARDGAPPRVVLTNDDSVTAGGDSLRLCAWGVAVVARRPGSPRPG